MLKKEYCTGMERRLYIGLKMCCLMWLEHVEETRDKVVKACLMLTLILTDEMTIHYNLW